MNGLYDILLVLFIFGAVIGFANSVHLFPHNTLPDAGYKIDTTTVTELQSAGASQTTNDFSIWSLIQTFMTAIGSGIVSLVAIGFVINGLLLSTGADPDFALKVSGLIQACATIVTVWGLYEMWTGRSVT
jgi:hypothetical protein